MIKTQLYFILIKTDQTHKVPDMKDKKLIENKHELIATDLCFSFCN